MFRVLPDQPQEKYAPDSACSSKDVEDGGPAELRGAQNATQGQRDHSSKLGSYQNNETNFICAGHHFLLQRAHSIFFTVS